VDEENAKRCRFGFVARSLILIGVTATIYVAAAAWGWRQYKIEGVVAASVAAGTCLAGAIGATIFIPWMYRPKRVIAGILLGAGFRMGVPLFGGIFVSLVFPPLAEAGLLYYLVVFFLPLLALETAFSLPSPPSPTENTPSSNRGAN
jgi:hypothetical protein